MTETRSTIQKTLVKKAVTELKTHPTAEELYEYVKKQCPCLSKATVYRNLNILAEKKEILKIEIPNASDHFDFNTNKHNHFVCRHCGEVVDIDFRISQVDVSDLSEKGYEVYGYNLIFCGVCPKCKEKANK